MGRDPEVLFREAWELAARRISAGKRSKDRIRFFLTDGTTKTFDIPPMKDESMKDVFLEITLKAILNYPVEAILLNYEAWFVDLDKGVTEDNIDAYFLSNPLPHNHPQRKEGVNFYYETADGTILTSLAKIRTVKKNKRELAKFDSLVAVKTEGRMSHFFKKSREYSKMRRNIIDDFVRRN